MKRLNFIFSFFVLVMIFPVFMVMSAEAQESVRVQSPRYPERRSYLTQYHSEYSAKVRSVIDKMRTAVKKNSRGVAAQRQDNRAAQREYVNALKRKNRIFLGEKIKDVKSVTPREKNQCINLLINRYWPFVLFETEELQHEVTLFVELMNKEGVPLEKRKERLNALVAASDAWKQQGARVAPNGDANRETLKKMFKKFRKNN